MQSDTKLDVYLVSRESLSASPDSVPPPAAGYRSISGRLIRRLDGGEQPAADAFVDYEPTMDFPAAMTFSDADGRYLLCGIPDGEAVDLCVTGGACVSVPAGQSVVDIVLPTDRSGGRAGDGV